MSLFGFTFFPGPIATYSKGRRVRWLALALGLASQPLVAQGGGDNEAKFNAKAALISARVVYLTTQSYTGVTAKLLREKNPELRFVDDAPSTGPASLSVKVLGPRQLWVAVYGLKTCWGIREEGRQSGVATLYARRPGPPDECKATSFKEGDFQEHEQVWRK
jgi:hypothetical protein